MANNNGNIIDDASQKSLLVNELVEGRDLTKQLYSILLKESTSTPNEDAHSLNVAHKILAKIESSLTFLRNETFVQPQNTNMGTIDSPSSFNNESPKTPDFEGDLKDLVDSKDDSRKRKVIPRYTLKVEGCRKTGLEGPLEDGFDWRKYGQKDIQGTLYPRAYYRCTQKHQGCLATKQVQRSNDDPTYFEVTYRGIHTCYQASSSSSSIPVTAPKPEPRDSSPCPKPQEFLLSFQTYAKDTKPTPHHSSPTPLRTTQHSLNNNNNNNNNNNINDDNKNNINDNNNDDDDNNNTNNNNNTQKGSSSSTLEPNEFVFDESEIDHDFIFNNLHLFK
ncbi:hypothetical protein RND81_12G105000 [Saponaria officinalis]|uniref:WRKY domain-containing protein n=1 Tax=Saponaria officinalis TaxID=3572 RepID=A0AAW1H8Y1_SAPOF